MTAKIDRVCELCGAGFQVVPSRVARGHGKYCSVVCARTQQSELARIEGESRFWSKVNRCGPVPAHRVELGQCWEWTGCVNRDGYGYMGLGRRNRLAHRVAWEMEHGSAAGQLCVLHKCDNPRCVRIGHLFLGTRADNIADKVRKGRQNKGLDCWNARLTADLVKRVRELHQSGLSYAKIGRALGISHSTAHRAAVGESWRHVS